MEENLEERAEEQNVQLSMEPDLPTVEEGPIVLNDEEKRMVVKHQVDVQNATMEFARVRREYLAAEQQLVGMSVDMEKQYMSYLKMLASAKGIDIDGASWSFDPRQFAFVKLPTDK